LDDLSGIAALSVGANTAIRLRYTTADQKPRTNLWGAWQLDAYLTSRGYEIKIHDLVPHTRQLARIDG